MKTLTLLLALTGSLLAQEHLPDQEAELDPMQASLERLLSERESPEALTEAIADARKHGATDQAILEARFIYHVDRREDAEIAALLPDFLKQSKKFRLSESQIFALEEDFLAVVEYVQAIASLEKGEREAFKQHITEAFWLSPRQGAAFAPHIERLRLEDAMQEVKIDFTLPLLDLNGNKTNLGELTREKKSLLLHFFSPWSRECEASMPDFTAAASELTKNGIAVVTMLGESGPELITDTQALLQSLPSIPSGSWVLDNLDNPLNRLLRVQNVPTMVLVGLDGKILYNGHPTGEELWKKLSDIAPGTKRPPVTNNGH